MRRSKRKYAASDVGAFVVARRADSTVEFQRIRMPYVEGHYRLAKYLITTIGIVASTREVKNSVYIGSIT